MKKKGFFSSHAKSSAALVSLGIHAVVILVALTFVAVTVVTKDDQKFEAKPVNRPKMQLKRLQVPVNVKQKKTQKPKLRKRIVVKPKMNQSVPDIKMPEISGVKGGLGGGVAGGIGAGGGVGFTMPEIEIFGVKGKGEKIFLILDTGAEMLEDEMGGIPAYSIIKSELIRIVEELPPTALFNICVFDSEVKTLFPSLVSANGANAQQVKDWLEPLNAADDAAKSGRYGIQTLGKGGVDHRGEYRIGKLAEPIKKGGELYLGRWSGNGKWFRPVQVAMQQQADTVFVLSNSWGLQRVAINDVPDRDEWNLTSAGKRWTAALEKAKVKFEEENKRRSKNGEPPKVIAHGSWGLIVEYFPDIERPPGPEFYHVTPRDFTEAFTLMKNEHRSEDLQATSGLSRRKSKSPKIDFSVNVVQFVRTGDVVDERTSERFKQLTQYCKGQYQTIAGLEEIQGYVK